MIWTPFYTFLYNILSSVFSDSITGNVAIPDNIFSVFKDVFGIIGYFFPIRELLPILIISFYIASFRVAIAILRFVKGFIPTMGG